MIYKATCSTQHVNKKLSSIYDQLIVLVTSNISIFIYLQISIKLKHYYKQISQPSPKP